MSPTKRGAEIKSVQAVDQTLSCRLHDVIIIKMETRSGSGLLRLSWIHVGSTSGSNEPEGGQVDNGRLRIKTWCDEVIGLNLLWFHNCSLLQIILVLCYYSSEILQLLCEC